MIIDASLIIDAVTDSGPRGIVARRTLATIPADEMLNAPGHCAAEVLSGLQAVARTPGNAFAAVDIADALADAEDLGVRLDPIPWSDVRRAQELSSALRYSDALYVAAAERHDTALATSDARIGKSGAHLRCRIITVLPDLDN